MVKLFADANVVAEILFQRQRYATCRDYLGQEGNWLFISALTIHLIYYLAEKNRSDLDLIKRGLDPYLLVPIDQRVVELAQARFTGRDFEDCLQAAAAEMAGCTQIATLDRQFENLSRTTLPVTVL